MSRAFGATAVILLVTGGTGCYRFTPTDAPARGMEIRAVLEAEAAARRSQGMVEPILHYDGVVLEAGGSEVVLDVLVARATSAFQDVEIRDTVRLRRTEVRALMERSISPGRTALAVVAVGAGVFAAVKGIDAVVGGTDDPIEPPPPQSVRIPVLSWNGLRLQPAFVLGRDDP